MPEFMPELGYIIQPDCFRWTMPRSICVHPDNRGVVALALGRNGFLTQGDLARHLEIALSTVNNFCRCVNVSVAKFEDICQALGLDARTLIKPAGAASEAAPEDENKAVGAESATDQFFAYDRAWVGRAGLIQSLRYQNFWRCQPLTGLTEAEQRSLFEQMGFDMQSESGDRPYLVRIGKAYEGHPLALRVIGGEIGSYPFFGQVVAYWNRYGSEIEQVEQALAAAAAGDVTGAEDQWALDRFTRALRRNVRKRLEQTFQRLRQDANAAYVLLCEASVYRCPVPEDWWLSHLEYLDLEANAATAAMDALRDRYLVDEVLEKDQYLLKQHNLIRSVALEHLETLDDNETT